MKCESKEEIMCRAGGRYGACQSNSDSNFVLVNLAFLS